MSTVEWETCRKLETGQGRNVNTAVGRRENCKIKREEEEIIQSLLKYLKHSRNRRLLNTSKGRPILQEKNAFLKYTYSVKMYLQNKYHTLQQ